MWFNVGIDVTYNEEKDKNFISLVESQRLKDREASEQRSLVRTNERLKRLGLEPIKDLDDVPDVISELDPYIEEAALITQDLIQYGRLAKNNIN